MQEHAYFLAEMITHAEALFILIQRSSLCSEFQT